MGEGASRPDILPGEPGALLCGTIFPIEGFAFQPQSRSDVWHQEPTLYFGVFI